MSKVYLSGPITGLHYGPARYGWRKDFAALLGKGIVALSPMRHEGHLAEMQEAIGPDSLPKNLFSIPKMIVEKDFLDIRESTVMVVNLLGATEVSQGTLVEIGYAKALGKTIVTIREEGNVHKSPFVIECSSVVCQTLEQAAIIVNSLLSEGI